MNLLTALQKTVKTTNSETMNTAHTLCDRVIPRCFVLSETREFGKARKQEPKEKQRSRGK